VTSGGKMFTTCFAKIRELIAKLWAGIHSDAMVPEKPVLQNWLKLPVFR
jgi:hypothetical protein